MPLSAAEIKEALQVIGGEYEAHYGPYTLDKFTVYEVWALDNGEYEVGFVLKEKNKIAHIFENTSDFVSYVNKNNRIYKDRIYEFKGLIGGLSQIDANKHMLVKPVFGRPETTENAGSILIIMPFKEPYLTITDRVKGFLQTLGLAVLRANDIFAPGQIMQQIWSNMATATKVVAECTERNPNVYYELGIAHTLGKEVIMITQDKESIPFDLRHMRYIVYDNSANGLERLDRDLINAFQGR